MIRILYEVLKVYTFDGLVAQLVRAPPCHGGGHGFESRLGRFIWDLSSAGRASALQAEGHRFEPYSGSFLFLRLHGQAVKTSPFHGGNTGSNPVGVIFSTAMR